MFYLCFLFFKWIFLGIVDEYDINNDQFGFDFRFVVHVLFRQVIFLFFIPIRVSSSLSFCELDVIPCFRWVVGVIESVSRGHSSMDLLCRVHMHGGRQGRSVHPSYAYRPTYHLRSRGFDQLIQVNVVCGGVFVSARTFLRRGTFNDVIYRNLSIIIPTRVPGMSTFHPITRRFNSNDDSILVKGVTFVPRGALFR